MEKTGSGGNASTAIASNSFMTSPWGNEMNYKHLTVQFKILQIGPGGADIHVMIVEENGTIINDFGAYHNVSPGSTINVRMETDPITEEMDPMARMLRDIEDGNI